ncbi:MAG: GIY-YIG nuclease family protein, partial [Deltaproteobacteria bacterium]|nr:GIY-YIG nuclease family protein [Deltaproteobacteria bacterium]
MKEKESILSSEESSVYIITSKDNSKIKIGKANNVFQRISAFSYTVIDYDRSLEIICRDEKAAKKIETMLHARFDDHRINSLEIGKFDGSTEWFSYDIFDLIEPFIIHSGDDRVVQIRNGIQIPKKSESVK